MAGKNFVGFKQYNEFVFKEYKLEIVLMHCQYCIAEMEVLVCSRGGEYSSI